MNKTMTIIKAGYRITVVSYECDGDYERTLIQEGLKLEDTQLIIKILSLYKGKFGNLYEPNDKQLQEEAGELIKTLSSYPNALSLLDLSSVEDLKDEQCVRVCVHDSILSNYLGSSENFYSRKVRSYKVEYVPQDIIIEDVTAKLFSLT